LLSRGSAFGLDGDRLIHVYDLDFVLYDVV
jgi:hypothetical protein